MLCIISDFIVSLGKFLMHLCLALHTEEKKNFVMATVVWDFQVTKKKKNRMESCFCLYQIMMPYSFHKVSVVT